MEEEYALVGISEHCSRLGCGGSDPRGRAAAGLGPIKGKVVWVDFWASWCVPCRRSFPWMNTMHRKYGAEGLEIIAVNLDKERALADGFLAETPAEFALRFDPAGALAKEFGVQAMPSSYLARRRRERHREPLRLQDRRHRRVRARDSRRARGSTANESLIERK